MARENSRSSRRQRGPRTWKVARIAGAFVLAGMLVAVVAFERSRPTEAAAGPALKIDAPSQVAVGDPIQVSLSVKNANGIAAYEVTAQYDTSIAHLSGLKQRQNDLKKLGRSVETVGPVDLSNGVTFGAYSCPFKSCDDFKGKQKNNNGGKGTIKLGTFSIVVDQPGTFTIQLASLKFTDPAGNPVSVDPGNSTITVEVQ